MFIIKANWGFIFHCQMWTNRGFLMQSSPSSALCQKPRLLIWKWSVSELISGSAQRLSQWKLKWWSHILIQHIRTDMLGKRWIYPLSWFYNSRWVCQCSYRITEAVILTSTWSASATGPDSFSLPLCLVTSLIWLTAGLWACTVNWQIEPWTGLQVYPGQLSPSATGSHSSSDSLKQS